MLMRWIFFPSIEVSITLSSPKVMKFRWVMLSKYFSIFCLKGISSMNRYEIIAFSCNNQSSSLYLTSLYWSKNPKKSFQLTVSFIKACDIHFWTYEGLHPFKVEINWAMVSMGSYCLGLRLASPETVNFFLMVRRSWADRSRGWKGLSRMTSLWFDDIVPIGYWGNVLFLWSNW